MTSDRHFFHSFPRPRAGETEAQIAAKGLAILQTVKDVGLILAPETVTWRVPLIDDTERTIEYEQTRICFTELSYEELPTHSKRFGPFALEFDISKLREIGALPVIYIPQSTRAGGLSAIGSVLAMELHHVEATIRLLEGLRVNTDEGAILAANPNAKSIAPDCVVNLTSIDDRGVPVKERPVPIAMVRAVLDHIGYKNAPFAEMMHALNYTKGLFYPTDDQTSDEVLAYYRQREWRIGPGMTVAGVVQSRPLSNDEKEKILRVDTNFWSRVTGKPPRRRIDSAQAISLFNGGPLHEAISRVTVPDSVREEAKKLFGAKVI